MDNEKTILSSLETIEKHIFEKLTIDKIASNIYFSKYYYQRLFREMVGDSVMEYVTKRKLTLAGIELLETDLTILDIALKFGYDSHEGFTRSFKAYMGISPKEYRKYNLATISQKTVKGKLYMTYSKSSNEIIRELNDFVAKARNLSEHVRKSGAQGYELFWNNVADHTVAIADRINDVLEQVNSIAEHPDEITNGYAILKIIDDTMFEINIFVLQIRLTAVGRAKPEHILINQPLCDKYIELAKSSELKAVKIIRFFNELSSLIIDDMRQTLKQKIQDVVKKGSTAAKSIDESSVYIKNEIMRLVNDLSSVPVESLTSRTISDCLFNMKFISLAAKVDMFRQPDSKAMFDGIARFTESLEEAINFYNSIIKPYDEPTSERKTIMTMEDIAFEINILLFYVKGEIENLSCVLSKEQKELFDKLKNKVENCMKVAVTASTANDVSIFNELSDMLNAIVCDMNIKADKLETKGGSIKILADELNILLDKLI